MRRRMLLVATLALAGCGQVVPTESAPPLPATIDTAMSPSDAYRAALRAVSSDFDISTSDAAGGFIETEWKSTDQKYVVMASSTYERRMRLHVNIDSGTVTVIAEMQQRAKGNGHDTDWSEHGGGFSAHERSIYDGVVADVRHAVARQ